MFRHRDICLFFLFCFLFPLPIHLNSHPSSPAKPPNDKFPLKWDPTKPIKAQQMRICTQVGPLLHFCRRSTMQVTFYNPIMEFPHIMFYSSVVHRQHYAAWRYQLSGTFSCCHFMFSQNIVEFSDQASSPAVAVASSWGSSGVLAVAGISSSQQQSVVVGAVVGLPEEMTQPVEAPLPSSPQRPLFWRDIYRN